MMANVIELTCIVLDVTPIPNGLNDNGKLDGCVFMCLGGALASKSRSWNIVPPPILYKIISSGNYRLLSRAEGR